MGTCLLLSEFVSLRIVGGLFLGVLSVPLCKPGSHLREPGI